MGSSEEQTLRAISQEASRIEEDCLFSSKGHFAASAAWGKLHLRIGLPAAIASAFAGVSAVNDLPVLAAVLSATVAALTATLTFLNPSDRSHLHHVAGTHFGAIRAEARRLREIETRSGASPDDLAKVVSTLGKAKDDLNSSSPQIPGWAFRRARKGIEAGEGTYAVDSSQSGAS